MKVNRKHALSLIRLAVVLALSACTRAPGPARPPVTPVRAAEPVPPPAAPARPRTAPLLSGESIPMETLDGKAEAMLDYAAPVTVLGFWSAACKPCIREMPYLDALYRRHLKEGDVAVLSINIDDPDELERARATVAPMDLSLPVLWDKQRALRRRINQVLGKDEAESEFALPLVLVLDPAAHVWSELGFKTDTDRDQYLAEKDQLIAEARAGSLPERRPQLTRQLPPGGIIRLSYSRMTEEQIEKELPALKQLLLQFSPGLSDRDLGRMLGKARAAMRAGRRVQLRMPR